jgi:nucleotide-binding universal stress UspA family protein
MTPLTQKNWSKPETILFATEVPPNEKVFSFALAQARQNHSRLILFHAYDTLVVASSEASGVRYYDFAAAARTETSLLEPFAEQARADGIECEVIVRPGLAADQILSILREKHIDRVVMGTRSPGPLGKILVGSVAEAVLRSAHIPVCVIGPDVVDQAFTGYKTKNILCAVGLSESSHAVALLAAELAVENKARLVLMHVMRPEDRVRLLEEHPEGNLETDLVAMIPSEIQEQISVETMILSGDPAEEVLFQAKANKVDLIVLGAQEASVISTLARQGVAYRVLAHAQAPVLTISPLAREHATSKKLHAVDVFLAGVF